MSAVDTFTTEKYGFPFVISEKGKTLVPFVHRIDADYGFGLGDIPDANEYFELFVQLSTREESQSEIQDSESIIFSHAYIMWQGTAEYTITENHHGERSQVFDPPIALPFNELWLSVYSVSATAAKFGMVRIYYTLQEMSAQEILVAREQYL